MASPVGPSMIRAALLPVSALGLLLALSVGAPAPAAAEGRWKWHSHRASHVAKRCAVIERALDRLERPRFRFRERGPWRLFHRLRRHAIRRLAFRYADHCVSLNQVQVLGTHNSYHVQPVPELIDAYVNFDPDAIFWEYTHRPLDEQFALQGVRQIELDVYADPEGGLHALPFSQVVLTGNERIPELEAPGMKVLHVVDLDVGTTCFTLIECLTIVKTWSDANPRHLPIVILVETKDDQVLFIAPVPFGPGEFDDLDAEIRSVFPPSQLITPDDVRGNAVTLEEAVLTRGWPTLAQSRGKVLFALDNGGQKRLDYMAGRPSLEGRVMFTPSSPGQPDAAFVKLNEPRGAPIAERVAEGYIVRTRADADTVEARENDTGRRDVALASGAQYVSTDYPDPNLLFSEYRVEIPDGRPGRCNPVNAPPGCRNFALER